MMSVRRDHATLSRSWMRQLFGASGVAVMVPGALVGAFAVLALAGGFTQLGAFSQAFSGPALEASGSSGGGAYFATSSGETLLAPCP